MKKTGLLFFALAAATFSQAQNKNVVSAINYLKYYKTDKKCDDLTEAKNFIDLATNHADTKESAKMWYTRGEVYQFIAETKDEKCKALSPEALKEAATSYENAIKFDEKKSYTDDAKKGLNYAINQFVNRGVGFFNEKNYNAALTSFEGAINVSKSAFNRVDTLAMYNAALAAEKANNPKKAIEMYKGLIDVKYGGEKEGPKLYVFMANAHRTAGDTAAYISTIQSGRKAYPNDKNLVIEELNYFLGTGKDKEAMANLNLAIEKDPKNPNLHFALGTVHDKLGEFEKAEVAYKKAIEIDPNYFDPQYNLGALYFNKAVKINDMANTITDNAKYAKEAAKADAMFKTALPYLEKAHQINPQDKSTMQSLKQLYLMTEQQDKFNEMSAKLKN